MEVSLAFTLLAVGWLWTTARAVWLARALRIPEHREWMLPSFALTFAAMAQRTYFALLRFWLGWSFETAYLVAAWACWVPNVLVLEWYIRRTRGAVVQTPVKVID